MLRGGFRHGFHEAAWEAAKGEARKVMYAVAARKRLIAYSDLVAQIQSVSLEAHDVRLAHFLGEISTEDDDDGRGLTTVIVVHKNGDQKPGPGFFELAAARGRDVSDPERCWLDELNAMYNYWNARKS